ncbi:NuoM family protein [Rufibacter glacialis]|uniref:NADH-quinone oxidoreductase subunit M n=1 Tax=Rufibacter glacialis TaxID=1259555 RepID=A0A5M8QLP6_9BACT|nr:NADH-quinone oxidoreductase subunit M [Rufibacter glacialis]KAA6437147.1 NADH-quinone oxidoreductase subunit M [Rufibacter glacialis]GGK61758.1 NADH-quinone oxidoreductase subunit M [Rufibacter glacialis]
MLTALLLLWPALAALLVLLVKGQAAKKVAFGAALVELVLGIWTWINFVPNASTQFLLNEPWIAGAGIMFKVGIDGISLLMVLLTVFLVPLIILSTFKHTYEKPASFYALILFMQTGLLGVFTALDAFVFYFFWEVALIPIYFIAGMWGGENRVRVTFKFFIYTVFGSLFMLAAFVYLYFQTPGTHSSEEVAFYQLVLDSGTQSWLFWFLFIAFAIKMPVFPFHTWQPDTYTTAPAAGTMLLSGIMLKMGIYGALRWLLPVVPLGVSQWANVVLVLAIIGIIYGAIIAIRQQDMKRLVAFSSISHVGLIAAGLFTLNEQGLQGAMIQMLSHGVNVVGLFFIIDIIQSRTGTRDIAALGGITQNTPFLSVCFLVLLLGAVGLPLTNGFIGEFLLLMSVYQYNNWMGAIAGLTIILGAVYMLRMFQRVMFGEKNEITQGFTDLTFTEKAVLVPLVVMVFWIGLHPNTFLNLSEPAVLKLLDVIKR